jgi:hypothetical protein
MSLPHRRRKIVDFMLSDLATALIVIVVLGSLFAILGFSVADADETPEASFSPVVMLPEPEPAPQALLVQDVR